MFLRKALAIYPDTRTKRDTSLLPRKGSSEIYARKGYYGRSMVSAWWPGAPKRYEFTCFLAIGEIGRVVKIHSF